MVQQIFTLVPRLNTSLGFVTAQEIWSTENTNNNNNNNNNKNNNNNNNNNNNKRPSQQPALGALTFLRSFVTGKANFCSHLASVVH